MHHCSNEQTGEADDTRKCVVNIVISSTTYKPPTHTMEMMFSSIHDVTVTVCPSITNPNRRLTCIRQRAPMYRNSAVLGAGSLSSRVNAATHCYSNLVIVDDTVENL